MFETNTTERLKIIWFAFLEACERFWDNRFRRIEASEEVEYLRREIEKIRQDYRELVNSVIMRSATSDEPDAISDLESKPIGGRPHWRVQANQMAIAAREEKRKQDEAVASQLKRKVPINAPPQTIEQLEEELLKVE